MPTLSGDLILWTYHHRCGLTVKGNVYGACDCVLDQTCETDAINIILQMRHWVRVGISYT